MCVSSTCVWTVPVACMWRSEDSFVELAQWMEPRLV